MACPTSLPNGVNKIITPSPCFPITKCDAPSTYWKDWTSELPEDVLVMILSRLTVKEAAKTSVLSSRWMDLWKLTSGSLNFDESATIWKMLTTDTEMSIEVKRNKFLDWVNQVIQSRQSPVIDAFRICVDIGAESDSIINSWIHFAFDKRVEKLELDFSSQYLYHSKRGAYTLTTKVIRDCCLDSLLALHLKSVEVTGEVLEHILSNSRSLEILSVVYSESLVGLKISGESPKLRVLEILYCHYLEYVEVSGVNLSSLKYYGPRIRFSFKEVPHVVEALIGGDYGSFVLHNAFHFYSYLSRLEKLALDTGLLSLEKVSRFPNLPNLKELELSLSTLFAPRVLYCTVIPKACPGLQRFTLKMLDTEDDDPVEGWEVSARNKRWYKLRAQARWKHKSLKLVEIVHFCGCYHDFDFAYSMIRNAVVLEKLIIDPWEPFESQGNPRSENRRQAIEKIRARAKLLQPSIPPGVELVIQ